MSSNFGLIGPPTAELATLERLKKCPLPYNGKKDVSAFSRLFMIGSFLYLQVMITYMRDWMGLKFSQIGLNTFITHKKANEHTTCKEKIGLERKH